MLFQHTRIITFADSAPVASFMETFRLASEYSANPIPYLLRGTTLYLDTNTLSVTDLLRFPVIQSAEYNFGSIPILDSDEVVLSAKPREKTRFADLGRCINGSCGI